MREIVLTREMVALVDDEDFERLTVHRWQAAKDKRTYYAVRTSCLPKRKTIRMHREIMNPPEGLEVDHLDGNGLNCQKSNLRVCTKQENQQNQRPQLNKIHSHFKGVGWLKNNHKWEAKIQRKRIGCFKTEEEAALAYDQVARNLFGKFARTNF